MTKIDEFKKFVKGKPNLIKYIENNEMTWQKFYEIYDIYGPDEKIWNKYELKGNGLNDGISKISNIVKSMDMDSIKNHIDTAQKAIDFVQDLTSKNKIKSNANKNIIPKEPRPINKFFED